MTSGIKDSVLILRQMKNMVKKKRMLSKNMHQQKNTVALAGSERTILADFKGSR